METEKTHFAEFCLPLGYLTYSMRSDPVHLTDTASRILPISTLGFKTQIDLRSLKRSSMLKKNSPRMREAYGSTSCMLSISQVGDSSSGLLPHLHVEE